MHSLKNFIEDLELKDCHEICKNDPNMYTYIGNNGRSRIDKICLSNKLTHLVKSCLYKDYLHSDHRAVLINIEITNAARPYFKSPYWKLNSSILAEQEYVMNFEETLTTAERNQNQSILDWWEYIFK